MLSAECLMATRSSLSSSRHESRKHDLEAAHVLGGAGVDG